MKDDSRSPSGSEPEGDNHKKEKRPIWAPIRVPPYRRIQTAAVLLWTSQLSLCISLFFFLMSYPITWPILLPYVIWILVIDPAPEKGGRLNQSVRTWKFWNLFASYFPISLIKTVDLPSDRKYVFGYHPHGIIGMGAVANFGTEATGFSEKFPGLNPHLLTLSTNFIIPFYRDLILSLGICSVSIKSCISILKSKNKRSADVKNNKGEGNCLVIVVGGAAESLSAHPGTADLTLKRRLGFIKLAIREGADLVPVFSFGENDIYAQLSNSKGTALYSLQKRFQAVFGFTLPVFHGRGIFNYSLGLLPYRHPIVSVVGKPIRVEQNKNPGLEEIEKVQKEYIAELTAVNLVEPVFLVYPRRFQNRRKGMSTGCVGTIDEKG
ncbi:diacylglycerol O-acyltransferase 1 [Puccinia graminis f. sp. tritici]|uniref:Diacylglycerol O-acyltransferase n=1 Tax=Puccinia graminis f. sp. tritici TaxID=56615 RepID=A0A5B0QIZ9_PUCGR|nr:diacylglycerol O-acyltransferase 1 [Puccinia graminis f. sp. tritici]